jgi:hypothetical protein
MFNGREEFLDEVWRKGVRFGKRMVYEKKKEMHEKYLKESLGWILGTIKRVEFIWSIRGWNIGRVARSWWYGPGVVEIEPSAISSWAGLGQISFWFAIQVFWVKAWATVLMYGKGEAAKWSYVSWEATSTKEEGWGGEEVRMGDWTAKEAWWSQNLGVSHC